MSKKTKLFKKKLLLAILANILCIGNALICTNNRSDLEMICAVIIVAVLVNSLVISDYINSNKWIK